MSRSRKRKPFISYTNAKSMKGWKRSYNRASRSRTKQSLMAWYNEDDLYLEERNIERDDLWCSPRDGRQFYFGDYKYPVCEHYYLDSRLHNTYEEAVEQQLEYYAKYMRK